jgi:hypothetical protein
MSSDTQAAQSPGHPSPHRSRAGLAELLFAVFGAPSAWAAQLVANFAVASHVCYPHDLPLARLPANYAWSWGALLAINLIAVAMALIAAGVSIKVWRDTKEEHPGSAHRAIEAGEGRTRFLALCGMMTGFGFLVAILFNSLALFTVPQCTG